MRRGPTREEREWWLRRRMEVWRRDGPRCRICGESVPFTGSQVAHLHALRAGRSRYRDARCSICGIDLNHPDNLVLTCSGPCNDLAAKRWEEERGCRRPQDHPGPELVGSGDRPPDVQGEE